MPTQNKILKIRQGVTFQSLTRNAAALNRAADRDFVNRLARNYGITPYEYEELLARQDYACAICLRSLEGGDADPFVDHCHTTGAVRGILCPNCNSGLGFFRDNTASLSNAISYLENTHDHIPGRPPEQTFSSQETTEYIPLPLELQAPEPIVPKLSAMERALRASEVVMRPKKDKPSGTERAWDGGPIQKIGTGSGKPAVYLCEDCLKIVPGVYHAADKWLCAGCKEGNRAKKEQPEHLKRRSAIERMAKNAVRDSKTASGAI